MTVKNGDIFRLWIKHTRGFRGALGLIFVSVIIANAAQLGIPYVFKRFIDLFSQGYSDGILPQVYVLLGTLLGIELITFVAFRLSEIFDANYFPKLNAQLLNFGHTALLRQEHAFFERQQSGALARRVSQYAESFENVYERVMWTLVPTLVNIVLVSVILGMRHWSLAVLLLGWAVIYVALVARFSLYKLKFDKKRAAADRTATGLLTDTIANHFLVRLLNGHRHEHASYTKATAAHALWQRRSWLLNTWLHALQSLLMITIELAIMWAAVLSWKAGRLAVSDFVLIQGYLGAIFMNTWNVGYAIKTVYEAFADAKGMGEVFLRNTTVADLLNAPRLKLRSGEIVFRDITFSYRSGLTALKHFNLTVSSGEKLAFVGPSGAGKSTVGKLLLRLYDPNKGEISIDGQNIAHIQQGSLRQQIATVPQEPLLFHRSIYENIHYARPRASKAEVIAAAKSAQAHGFITRLPKGYDTVVGERGTRLSGGERQRIALARAFLQNAPIILMDEPTSSLDSLSEKTIQRALKQLFTGRTVVVIAHRLATIKEMDRICVIDHGTIVEEGAHTVLSEAEKGTYRKLWQIQTDH